MTDDLTTRLRQSDGFRTRIYDDGLPAIVADTNLMHEAADRIEKLEAVINDLVSEMHSTGGEVWLSSMRHDFPDKYQFLNKHIEQRELETPS